jgi:hypothetical protein
MYVGLIGIYMNSLAALRKYNSVSYLVIIYFLITMFACSQDKKYTSLVDKMNNPESEICEQKKIRDVIVKLSYKPHGIMVHQFLGSNNEFKKSSYKEYYQQVKDKHYFKLSISKNNTDLLSHQANSENFSQLVNTILFSVPDYIIAHTESRDTLDLLDFHTARYYGASNSTDVLLVFEKETTNANELIIKINDFGHNTGNLKFRFSTNKLKKYNNIKLTK